MNQMGLSLAMQILLQAITALSDEKISPHTHLASDVKGQHPWHFYCSGNGNCEEVSPV
jgi:hypothetical protein